jgi:hypothetical protein
MPGKSDWLGKDIQFSGLDCRTDLDCRTRIDVNGPISIKRLSCV